MTKLGLRYLESLLAPGAPPFALLHRPVSGNADEVELLVGDITSVATLAELPPPPDGDDRANRHDLVVLVPYRQIAERGFAAQDDGVPLLAMQIREQDRLAVTDVLDALPDQPIEVLREGFDLDDQSYSALVRTIINEEIGTGEGANFVIKRSFTADLGGRPTTAALTLFRRLLRDETGAYWTFLLHTGTRVLVGATPECHAHLEAGALSMNPISGTYRYPAQGPTVPDFLRFLADAKETDELYMVVDEELKMMARICAPGIQVNGPYVREMARLAHTEYVLTGQTGLAAPDILRETMFVPTVTGSPLENACRVIQRFEPEGRRYYSGVLALIGRHDAGTTRMDSAVLIRTADITEDGTLRTSVGATLVRHSDPESEAAETRAKSAALVAAVHGASDLVADCPSPGFADNPAVLDALARRNTALSGFWLTAPDDRATTRPELLGRHVLVIDGEDTFTAMLGHQLRALGLRVTTCPFDDQPDPGDYHLVLVGPGPGDPRDLANPKIAVLRRTILWTLRNQRPLLAICLGHQVLCGALGLDLVRKVTPNQGCRQKIDFFGRPTLAGFYNTFAAVSDGDAFTHDITPGAIAVCRDPGSGEVHALRGRHLSSLQFHPESLLSEDGVTILGEEISSLLGPSVPIGA